MIPDDLENHQLFHVNIYETGIKAVKKDITNFTNGMKCDSYHKLHSFDQCSILNNIPYIKKHSVSYCLLMNKTQKQMLAAIHHIDATWYTDINNNNNNNNEDYLCGNTDNDPDFQEKE